LSPRTTDDQNLNSPPERILTAVVIAGFAFALSALVLFAWLADEVLEGQMVRFDQHVRLFIHQHSSPAFTFLMRFMSNVGSPVCVTVLMLLAVTAFWRAGWQRAPVLLMIAMGGGALLNEALKLIFQRTRPVPYFDTPLPASYSFPSGHALFAVCFYGMVASLISARTRRLTTRVAVWTIAAVMIFLIGLSRIYLGVHYPTDVIAGYAAAFVWLAAISFGDRLYRRRRVRT
jgi:undecaprenyl-diphosphatase